MEDDKSNIAKQFIRDFFIEHRIDAIDELLAEKFSYSSELIKDPKGKEWIKDTGQQVFAAFPDFLFGIETVKTKDDIVTMEVNISGTLHQDFMGITAREQNFSGKGVIIFEIKEEKINQIQAKFNTADYLAQLK